MTNHRYSAEYVQGVRVAEAREFLATEGLPERSVLFVAQEAKEQPAFEERQLLRIGGDRAEGSDAGGYHIDCASGVILYLNHDSPVPYHVNASPAQFAACLRAFGTIACQPVDSADDVDLYLVSERLREEILSIDSTTATADDPFWESFYQDVASGDYVVEGDADQSSAFS